MKNINVQKFYCKSCKQPMEGGRSYLANPYCNDKACYDVRLEEIKSVDLQDNREIIDHNNGYVSVKPIDSTKLWKASEENKKIVAERRKKYYEENSDH